MMKLIADSSANLTMLEGVTYQSVPMTIRAGERDFVDDETLDTHELLDYLVAYNGKSGTACPSLDGWLKAFEGADEIFVITITSSLSGTCASAMAARDVYLQSHPEVKIRIFDTLSTGPEMQLRGAARGAGGPPGGPPPRGLFRASCVPSAPRRSTHRKIFSKIVLASAGEFPYSTFSHGGVAQLGERLTGSQEVRGSIPLVSTRALNEAPTQVGAFFHIGTQGQRRHHDPSGRQDRKKLRRTRPL